MGKRYYCDYCDRSFKDDIEARKKHLSSLQHARNRADHYSAFKDPETILKEEYGKVPCKRYMTVGDCAFGLGCRFSHYTPQMMRELQRLVATKNSGSSTIVPKNGWPNPQDIIKEYFENAADESSDADESAGHLSVWNIDLSPRIPDYNLPPSLWPATSESIAQCTFGKWG